MKARAAELLPYEAEEQATLVEWARLSRLRNGHCIGDYLIMIPNETLLNGAPHPARMGYLSRLRQRGFRDGASDLFLAWPAGKLHGLWIEMKRTRRAFRKPEKAVTQSQRAFGQLMQSAGYGFVVAYGASEAMRSISDYLGGELK